MSVQRVKYETSASELVVWSEYLKREQYKKFDKEKLDYYLAQIACETRRSFVKDPKKVKLDDFLLKFSNKSEKSVTKESRTKEAKQFWLSAFGIKE